MSAFLLTDDAAPKLTQSEPPAWAYFADTNNPTSSTAIRKAAQTSPEKRANVTDLVLRHMARYHIFSIFIPDLGDFKTDVINGTVSTAKMDFAKIFL